MKRIFNKEKFVIRGYEESDSQFRKDHSSIYDKIIPYKLLGARARVPSKACTESRTCEDIFRVFGIADSAERSYFDNLVRSPVSSVINVNQHYFLNPDLDTLRNDDIIILSPSGDQQKVNDYLYRYARTVNPQSLLRKFLIKRRHSDDHSNPQNLNLSQQLFDFDTLHYESKLKNLEVNNSTKNSAQEQNMASTDIKDTNATTKASTTNMKEKNMLAEIVGAAGTTVAIDIAVNKISFKLAKMAIASGRVDLAKVIISKEAKNGAKMIAPATLLGIAVALEDNENPSVSAMAKNFIPLLKTATAAGIANVGIEVVKTIMNDEEDDVADVYRLISDHESSNKQNQRASKKRTLGQEVG